MAMIRRTLAGYRAAREDFILTGSETDRLLMLYHLGSQKVADELSRLEASEAVRVCEAARDLDLEELTARRQAHRDSARRAGTLAAVLAVIAAVLFGAGELAAYHDRHPGDCTGVFWSLPRQCAELEQGDRQQQDQYRQQLIQDEHLQQGAGSCVTVPGRGTIAVVGADGRTVVTLRAPGDIAIGGEYCATGYSLIWRASPQ